MRRFDFGWLALWGTLASAWCLTAAEDLSATFDEPFYVQAGVTSWRTGSNQALMKAGTMPLPVDVQSLPIYLWERMRGQPFDLDQDFHTILPYARAMNLVFLWVLLGYGTLVARLFGGPWAGRVAVLLLATEPSLLGHSCLATTDIAITGLILAFAYHFYRGRDESRLARWIIPGLLYGLALAAKVSALSFVPLLMVAMEMPRWRATWNATARPEGVGRVRQAWRITGPFRMDSLKIFAVGMAFVWVYCGTDWEPHPRFVQQTSAMPEDGRWTRVARWAAQRIAVFPNAGQAFQYQFKHNLRGHHGTYLLGTWHPNAVPAYYPTALTIKLTLPVLAVLAGLAVLRPRALLSSLAFAALLFLLLSLNCRVQIGIRLVFPLVSMLLLAIAVGVARATATWTHSARTAALVGLTLALTGPALAVWPDGLRYGNELWGGSEETYRHLSDSNSDWGQGLKDLDRWTAANGLPRSHVWYYGRDPAMMREPDRWLGLHQLSDDGVRSPKDLWPHVRGKVVAVSTTLLHGHPRYNAAMAIALEFLQTQTPVGKTRTFVVYDFRD